MSLGVGKEPICRKCGGNEFKLTRTKDEITAECCKCRYPYLINSLEGKIVFLDPATEEISTEGEKGKKEDMVGLLKKAPEELQQKSVEELIEELIKFVIEEAPKDARFSDIACFFWRKKGLSDSFFMRNLDPVIELKRLKVESNVQQKFGYEYTKNPQKIFEAYQKEILEKAKEHNLKKVTKTDIDLYFMINREFASRKLVRLLHRSVNLELKKAKT